MSKLLIVIVVAALIGIAVFFIINKPGPKYPSPSPTTYVSLNNQQRTYTNSNYNDSFEYPGDYTLNSEYPNYLLLKKPSAPEYDWTYKINTLQNETGGSFDSFVTTQLMLGCAADGPNSSLSCDKVTSTVPFQTTSGVMGSKIYLNQITKTNGKTTTQEIGPYYALDISEQTDNKATAITFGPGDFTNLDETNPEDAKVLESMAKSFKFN